MHLLEVDPHVVVTALKTATATLDNSIVQALFKEAKESALETGKELVKNQTKIIVSESATLLKKRMRDVVLALKRCLGQKPAIVQLEQYLENNTIQKLPENIAEELSVEMKNLAKADQMNLQQLANALKELQTQNQELSEHIQDYKNSGNSMMTVDNQGAIITKQLNAFQIETVTF
jgi:vancomycin resistance protein YoaR